MITLDGSLSINPDFQYNEDYHALKLYSWKKDGILIKNESKEALVI